MQQIVDIPFILTLLCDEVWAFLTKECMLERLLERGKSSGRSDDNAESIKKRFVTAKEETQPVLEIFRNQGKLVEINSQRDINSIFEEISKHFDKIWSNGFIIQEMRTAALIYINTMDSKCRNTLVHKLKTTGSCKAFFGGNKSPPHPFVVRAACPKEVSRKRKTEWSSLEKSVKQLSV